ncbi:hypothetical protein BU16DRAFT_553292 [Lophium mytilinum]|uniref:AB hydrolase-1 domain-containing protein n=1 Tax=Lophium mytilinum TaxID=390894 RepID=A0A6A6QDL3_9PEZI|nr:hypothetical protein BU16DRAFT_553292 [Lophium mytilinum]
MGAVSATPSTASPAAATSTGAATLQGISSGAGVPLAWSPCAEGMGLECATLDVPLDWSHPSGPNITLGMNRLKATSPSQHIGSLIINPGGPGGAATRLNIDAANLETQLNSSYWSPELRAAFDIVAPDPRGIGSSTPIRCDPDIYNERVTTFPTTTAEFEKLVAHNKALGESCRNLTGPLFDHVDTTSVARDLEAVRLALGGEKLNYLGFSYGTQIGAAYAELFPDNFRTLALDAITDHSQSETSTLVTEASTYADALGRFLEWCEDTPDCAIGKNATRVFDEFLEKADKTPVPAPGCVESGACRANVTGEELRFAVQELLAFKNPAPGIPASLLPTWREGAEAIALAIAGNATALSTGLAATPDDGVYGGLAVGCQDWSHSSTTLSDVLYLQQLGGDISPRTKGASQSWSYQTLCIGWPAPLANPQHKIEIKGKVPPILLVNAYHDPETSYVWAHGLLKQLPSAQLLTRDGDGHTSYSLKGETWKAMDAYLIHGTMPGDNLVLKT